MKPESIVYRVDASDRIIDIEGPWDAFATPNRGPMATRVLGRSLFEFLTDPSVRQIYAAALSRVRAGRSLRFPFRCDSPSVRRSLALEMVLSPVRSGAVELRSSTRSLERRPSISLLSSEALRDEREVKMCSWCKRVAIDTKWVEVEEGVARLGLFEGRTVPGVTHTVCLDCAARMAEVLGGDRGGGGARPDGRAPVTESGSDAGR